MAADCMERMCEVEKADVKEKTVRPPKLYDLTTLQREANRIFGYTAQQLSLIHIDVYKRQVWRHGWETMTNRYLEAAGRPERVDRRSFERQGIQQIPTVHLGPAAHQMEKRGVETFLGNLNRDIRAANSLMQSIRSGECPIITAS